MLRSIKSLYGEKLAALDGGMGRVKDFYFDDLQWMVRYVVVDCSSWLPGRLVLISPHAFGNFAQDDGGIRVNLTRLQIEGSPGIELHRPVSRRYEEKYHCYYGLPRYWEGGGLWGVGGYPVTTPAHFGPTDPDTGEDLPHPAEDPHLRSTQAVTGYDIQTFLEPIGHVWDFIIDDTNWVIRHLLVETGHWYAGKEIVISPYHIDRIDYEFTRVFVTVTKEQILAAPEYRVPTTVCYAPTVLNL